MPDESCRVCGGVLIDYSQCAECKKIISLICKSCHSKTMEQFHSDCVMNSGNFGNHQGSLSENMRSLTLA